MVSEWNSGLLFHVINGYKLTATPTPNAELDSITQNLCIKSMCENLSISDN